MSDTGGNEGRPAYDTPAPPAAAEEPERVPYLGVGEDYTVPPSPGLGTTSMWPGGTPANPFPEGVSGRLPQYEDGDEWELFLGLSPESIAMIQEQFQEMGLIPVTATLPYGSWDQTTATAMREVLSAANVTGNNWQYTLRQMARNAPGYLTEAREEEAAKAAEEAERERKSREPTLLPPFKSTNPDDLRAIYQQVARRVIGRRADEQSVNQFVNNWIANESARYSNRRWDPESRQWIDLNTVEMPSADVAAEKALLGDYGDEAGAMATLQVMDMFEQMIAKPAV